MTARGDLSGVAQEADQRSELSTTRRSGRHVDARDHSASSSSVWERARADSFLIRDHMSDIAPAPSCRIRAARSVAAIEEGLSLAPQ